MMQPIRAPRSRVRGLALVLVLSLVTLLSLLATAALALTRSHATLAARTRETVVAQTIADSAMHLLRWQASAPAEADRARTLGNIGELTLFGQRVPVRIELEQMRIDLNVADADLIAAALARGAPAGADVQSLAARILDW